MKILFIVLTLCSISWCDKSPIVDKFLSKIGEYEFQNENNQTVVKSYYVARDFLVNWKDAFITCKASGMDLVELPTEAEADFFLNLCDQQQVFLKHQTFHLGGSYIGAGNDEFYWMTTEKRVNYKLKWAPGEPNNAGVEKCLTIFKSGSTYLFNNIVPNSPVLNFFCQHITNASSKLVVDPSKTEKLPNCNPALVEWLPHPTSCNKFFLCFHGTPIENTCAPNLRFSAKQERCISSQLPCCPAEDDVMNPIYLANLKDCSKYYLCYSGKAIERSCAKGLFFDTKTNMCIFPENFCCGSTPVNDNANVEEAMTVDTSICKWHGNLTGKSGSYIKSLCYYDKLTTYDEASDICNDNGMRLLRIEDNAVQTAVFAFILDMFGKGNDGIYHISGKSVDGSWYHDETTSVSDNLRWKDGNIPESGCLALCAYSPFSIDAFSCSKNLHSICEFVK